MAKANGRWRRVALLLLFAGAPAVAEEPPRMTVEKLLRDGWELAGYAANSAMIGSVMLFKHKDRNYFVQCSAVYDATRSPHVSARIVTNCYEVR